MPNERISRTLRDLADAIRDQQHGGSGGEFSVVWVGPDDPEPEPLPDDDGSFRLIIYGSQARAQPEVTPEDLDTLADDPGDLEIAVQEGTGGRQSDDPVNSMGMPRPGPETPDGFTFIETPRDPLLAKHQQALRMTNQPRPEPAEMSPELLFDDFDTGVHQESSGPEPGRRRHFKIKRR